MPLSAEFDLYSLLAFRFLQGVSYAADFAAVGALCSSWASLKQNGFFLGVLTSYSPLSSGLTNFIGGMVCNSRFGWPMVSTKSFENVCSL
jgi:MFS family permease